MYIKYNNSLASSWINWISLLIDSLMDLYFYIKNLKSIKIERYEFIVIIIIILYPASSYRKHITKIKLHLLKKYKNNTIIKS